MQSVIDAAIEAAPDSVETIEMNHPTMGQALVIVEGDGDDPVE